MTSLARFFVESTGYAGGPGVNVLTFSTGTLTPPWTGTDVQTVYDELHDAYDAIKLVFPNTVSITIAGEAVIFDSETANITNVIPVPTPAAAIVGTGAYGTTSRGQAICLAYYTDMWTGGKRLKGRSFIGPVDTGIYGVTGLFAPSIVDLLEDNWVAMTSGVGPRLAVYHRPSPPDPLDPTVPMTDGYYGDVVSVFARPRPSNLRSRQD